jgi:two-component system NtrC family sensor kinase
MFYHFILNFLGKKKGKIILYSAYTIAIFFIFILWRTNYFINGLYKYHWGYFLKISFFHSFHLLFYVFLLGGSLTLIYNYSRKKELSLFERNRIKYMFLVLLTGSLAIIDFLPSYGIKIYPFGFIFIVFSVLVLAYSIIKYRLMNIKVALTRTGIFIAVYTLVLGLPFAVALGFKNWLMAIWSSNWWMSPLILMAVLATVGPFIYLYINRKAEEKLLKEQRHYQNILKQSSLGMTRIRNLRKLLNLITHIVTKTVRISYAAIYLYNQQTNEFILQVNRDKNRMPLIKLGVENPLINWIMAKRQSLIYEEIKHRMQDTNVPLFKALEEDMRMLGAAVVVPSFLEQKLTGFIVLGDKLSGQIYTPDDLNVFQVLASQAALAIENAQFYEETKEMQAQIAQAEKMATIGTMADGLSHQINNRFYALSLIAGDTIDTIKMTDTSRCSPEIQEMLKQINYALERIEANVIQGGEVVDGILKYTRKGEEGMEVMTLDQLIDGTIEMVQYKVKLSEIDIIRDYPKDIPKIKANQIQMQEVFFNFIDNAYDAIVERRDTLKESGYRGKIVISAKPKDSALEVIVQDNGMGIKNEDLKKIFTPFFTTKTSARKGTGLGLYVIRNIITETHKGKITFDSEYKVGTRFVLELPLIL